MSDQQDDLDLDLLLSLQDRVLETPPASPSTHHSQSTGYLSDEGSPQRRGQADMSAFRNVVEDCLDYKPEPVAKPNKLNRSKTSNEAGIEKFSGLRIRDQSMTPTELSDRFSDIKFVRLSAIKNLMVGETLSGCWATVGVLTEKGIPRTSSTGKTYSIWKLGCLDEKTVTVFLFGDAYQRNCKEKAGTVFALFNCSVRKDNEGSGFSLSVYNNNQILKMGTSVDYGVCKGKKKDGVACTLVINKNRGIYCKFHKSKATQKYSAVTRTELKGGNLRTAFRGPQQREGIYMVDPFADKPNFNKSTKPVKLLSVDGLKKALSNAGRVTTNTHSQGIRFLTELTVNEKSSSKYASKESVVTKKHVAHSEKRKSNTVKVNPAEVMRNQEREAKRRKTEQDQALREKSKQGTEKMIELDFVSSDEGF